MAPTRPRWVSRVGGLVFLAAALLGAVAGDYPLVRVGSWIALASAGLSILAPRVLSERRLNQVGLVVLVLMVTSFIGMMTLTSYLGGGAINGTIRDGRYYLAQHGASTEVGPTAYYTVALFELTVFATWPAGFLLARRVSSDGPNTDSPGQGQQDAA